MYINDRENIIYEDIYDGKRLIRKNNRDSIVRIYDLVKFPGFKSKHFWSHNTLYGMQYEFKYMLDNEESYTIERLNDTVIDNKNCYQILVSLENKTSMPGFAAKLKNNEGSVMKTFYFIEKETCYTIQIRGEYHSIDKPEQKTFIDQRYYDIKFNLKIDEDALFNTSDEFFTGFEIKEIKPD